MNGIIFCLEELHYGGIVKGIVSSNYVSRVDLDKLYERTLKKIAETYQPFIGQDASSYSCIDPNVSCLPALFKAYCPDKSFSNYAANAERGELVYERYAAILEQMEKLFAQKAALRKKGFFRTFKKRLKINYQIRVLWSTEYRLIDVLDLNMYLQKKT